MLLTDQLADPIGKPKSAAFKEFLQLCFAGFSSLRRRERMLRAVCQLGICQPNGITNALGEKKGIKRIRLGERLDAVFDQSLSDEEAEARLVGSLKASMRAMRYVNLACFFFLSFFLFSFLFSFSIYCVFTLG